MTAKRRISAAALANQLDRTHQFFPRVDNKVSALFAIVSAQIAVAAINLSPSDLAIWWIAAPLVIYLALAVWIMGNLYRCSYPHLEGGNSSLLYFQEIAKLREAEYLTKIIELEEFDYAKDLAGQIWRNSEILNLKFQALKKANIGAIFSLVPWSVFLLATAINSTRIPII